MHDLVAAKIVGEMGCADLDRRDGLAGSERPRRRGAYSLERVDHQAPLAERFPLGKRLPISRHPSRA